MKFIKKLLGIKNKEVEVKEEIIEEDLSHLPHCVHCGNPIREYETMRTYAKSKYHIQCFRRVKKRAKTAALNGDISGLGFFSK